MTAHFKPMLSGKAPDDISTLRFPVLVSPKLDGVRCIIRDGVALSRTLKPIPNAYVQKMLAGLPDGLDGELIVGAPTGDDVINRTTSGVMSQDGEPDFTYWVFDYLDKHAQEMSEVFTQRYSGVVGRCSKGYRGAWPVEVVPHVMAANETELLIRETDYVEAGYEGAMIRDPNGLYKYGRSTVKEGGLLKLKRWHDAEAVVVGMVERMHNGNEATKDELGHTKRSSHKENKSGRGDMGALVCVLATPAADPAHPAHHNTRLATQFEIGTGFTDEQRADLWTNSPVGRVVTFKYQVLTPDGVPRFPVFKNFRYEIDF